MAIAKNTVYLQISTVFLGANSALLDLMQKYYGDRVICVSWTASTIGGEGTPEGMRTSEIFRTHQFLLVHTIGFCSLLSHQMYA